MWSFSGLFFFQTFMLFEFTGYMFVYDMVLLFHIFLCLNSDINVFVTQFFYFKCCCCLNSVHECYSFCFILSFALYSSDKVFFLLIYAFIYFLLSNFLISSQALLSNSCVSSLLYQFLLARISISKFVSDSDDSIICVVRLEESLFL